MKKLSILALSTTVAITPAFAETTAHYNTPSVDTQTVVLPQTTVSTITPQVDLSFAFDDVENLQTKDMTLVEMQETEGAVALHAIGGIAGGLGGHFGYMSSVAVSGQYNFGGHLASVGFGALGGAASPAKGIGSVAWGLGFGTASGAGTGYLTSKFPTVNVK